MGGSSVIKAFHYFVGFGAEKAASKLQETVLPPRFCQAPQVIVMVSLVPRVFFFLAHLHDPASEEAFGSG